MDNKPNIEKELKRKQTKKIDAHRKHNWRKNEMKTMAEQTSKWWEQREGFPSYKQISGITSFDNQATER